MTEGQKIHFLGICGTAMGSVAAALRERGHRVTILEQEVLPRCETAVEAFRAAAQVEDQLLYEEPPLWYYPIRQSLGRALLDAGRAHDAERVYREDLDRFAADHLPPASAWPRIDYRTLPELAAYPAQMNCAVDLLERQLERFAARPAIRAPGVCWSYAELNARADALAWTLRDDLGVRPGDRVILRAPNNPMAVACWFAIVKAGAIAVATSRLTIGTAIGVVSTSIDMASRNAPSTM